MRVLFTNNTLAGLAGSELYVFDLAVELQRRGHEVTCFTLGPGLVAERLRRHGICVESRLRELPEVDVIHAHHRLPARLAAARFPNTPLVYVCHGVRPGPERPGPDMSACAARVIAVSDDVRANLVALDGIPSGIVSVIPNFVDIDRFRCRRPISPRPRRVLVVSNHWGSGGTREIIRAACRIVGGLDLRVIGETTRSVWDVEEHIEWADVVISLGRGTLQAMSMGRPAVVYDYRGGDGLVTSDNFDELASHNFSGRAHNRQYTADALAREIVGYDHADVLRVMERVRSERSVSAVAEQILACYSDARAQVVQASTQSSRAARLERMLSGLAECAEESLSGERELSRRLAQGRVMRAMNAAQRVAGAVEDFGGRWWPI